MIIELLFNLVIGLVNLILVLVPDVTFSFDLPDTTSFREFLGLADFFIPTGTIISAIGVLILIQNTQFILKIFNFVYQKIPFI